MFHGRESEASRRKHRPASLTQPSAREGKGDELLTDQ
jgi:hypothetical protein